MIERMLALFLISIICFFALFFAMIALLRHAAATSRAHWRRPLARPHNSRTSPESLEESDFRQAFAVDNSRPTSRTRLSPKRPDWRFLVRDRRRSFSPHSTVTPLRKPALQTSYGKVRSDWAYYNRDLGDLKDPYQADPAAARRA